MPGEILDSGSRRKFESGAVRDIVEGKGRCDLLPLDSVARMLEYKEGPEKPHYLILMYLHKFITTGESSSLYAAVEQFVKYCYDFDAYTAILEVAKHYEQGCNKYGERNWEKGIPLHCYMDSGIRHLLKYFRGDIDEPHDRAFLWNMLGADWTMNHHPELVDLPFVYKSSIDDSDTQSE